MGERVERVEKRRVMMRVAVLVRQGRDNLVLDRWQALARQGAVHLNQESARVQILLYTLCQKTRQSRKQVRGLPDSLVQWQWNQLAAISREMVDSEMLRGQRTGIVLRRLASRLHSRHKHNLMDQLVFSDSQRLFFRLFLMSEKYRRFLRRRMVTRYSEAI